MDTIGEECTFLLYPLHSLITDIKYNIGDIFFELICLCSTFGLIEDIELSLFLVHNGGVDDGITGRYWW